MADYDTKSGNHYRTRAVGRVYVGPVHAQDNRLLEITARELEFKSSVESQKYMDQIGRKFAPKKTQMCARRLKHISQGDDS